MGELYFWREKSYRREIYVTFMGEVGDLLANISSSLVPERIKDFWSGY